MAHRYDAIVIGAGPSGTTAAIKMAESGLSVLLLEKQRLPRDKPCAGGLTPKAAAWLPVPIDDLVLHQTNRIQVRCGPKRIYRFQGQRCAIWMIRRREMDLRLAEEAAHRGVELHDGEPALGLVMGTEVAVNTSKGDYQARVVIGADGAESRVARWLSLERPRRWMITLNSEVAVAGDPLAGEVAISLDIPYGYGWVFPKGGYYSIGLGTFRQACARELRPMYHRFVEEVGLSLDRHPALTGHRIPSGLITGPLHRNNGLLVGDAAGVADPFFAEGISYAALSGRLAAKAVADYLAGRSPNLSTYTHQVKSALWTNIQFWGSVAAIVYRFPALSLRILAASRWLQTGAERTISGDVAFLHPVC